MAPLFIKTIVWNIVQKITYLAKCNSSKAIPVLMNCVNDDRSLDLPGDDYGNTTINYLAINTLSEIWEAHPDLFINYNEDTISNYKKPETLLKWWEKNKQFYK